MPGRQFQAWLALLAILSAASQEALASWTVDTSAAAAHLGGPSTHTFPTLAEAQAFVAANKNYGARLVPGGSDDMAGGNPGGGSRISGLTGGNTPGLTPQQQLALTAAQAAIPLFQQAARSLLSGSARPAPPRPGQSPSQIAAQQLYNSGMWYLRQNDYANALVEFQKALQRAPGNQQIMDEIARTRHQLDLAAQAAKGNGAPAVAPAAPPPPTPATALNLISFDHDSSVVDLRAATKTAVDPADFKADSPSVPSAPAPPPPATNAQLDKLYQQSFIDDNNRRIELRRVEDQIDDLFLKSATEDFRQLMDKQKP